MTSRRCSRLAAYWISRSAAVARRRDETTAPPWCYYGMESNAYMNLRALAINEEALKSLEENASRRWMSASRPLIRGCVTLRARWVSAINIDADKIE